MKNKKKRITQVLSLKIALFGLTLAIFAVIGLIWFLRPTVSTVEKRTLTQFPRPTFASVWDGSFFSEVDTWYADTYPLRESLIGANQSLQTAYGLRDSQIVGGGTRVADEIPDVEDVADETSADATVTPSSEETPAIQENSSEEPEQESAVAEESPEEEESYEDGTIYDEGEMQGSIYITDHQGYSLYYFIQEGVDYFISKVNSFSQSCPDSVHVYTLIAPISAGVMVDEQILEDLGCSNEEKAIEYIYNRLSDNITKISVFDTLKKHNAEYIYFHTDHHWTQLGTYYAYQKFCEQKGWTPHDINDFETMTFPDFLGTFYSKSEQSSELENNPDTVYAYVPQATNQMFMITQEDEELNWKIIYDVSDYQSINKYSTFCGGDNKYSCIHNEAITDGSAICIVKDSFGNSFAPWLVDHYEYVYILDVRYTENTISQMVADHGIQDVLLLCNLDYVATNSFADRIEEIGR